MDISNLTPNQRTISIGVLLKPDKTEEVLIAEAGAPLCLIGSYLMTKELAGKLPGDEDGILNMAMAGETEKELLSLLDDSVKIPWLKELSKTILKEVKAITIEAVRGVLHDINPYMIEEAERNFQDALEKRKAILEEGVLYVNDPTENQVLSMMPRKGETTADAMKKAIEVFYGCIQDSDFTDKGEKVPVSKVIALIRERGMVGISALRKWQETLPLA